MMRWVRKQFACIPGYLKLHLIALLQNWNRDLYGWLRNPRTGSDAKYKVFAFGTFQYAFPDLNFDI